MISNIRKAWLVFSSVITLLMAGVVQAEPQRMPEPDPPMISFGAPASPSFKALSVKAAPTTEWTYHKTADNLHPDGIEQQMMWLMNRARSNPSDEGVWLATMDDADVAFARTYFNVDLDVLMDEFDAIDASPPAAFDLRLYNAAKAHSEDLIARDAQDHDNQFTRVASAGFSYLALRGNVFSYTESGIHGHAGFNIDWGGTDGTGMQTGRGHRLAIMSMDNDYTNVGLSVIAESDNGTQVGPLVTTGNYALANEASSDHYNRFLVGTVWDDANDNDRYDPGEGLAGITIRPDKGTYYAVTSNSGGYAIPMASGTYDVTFSGSSLAADVTESVTVGSVSVLLDYEASSGVSGGGSQGSTPGQTPATTDDGSGGGCFIETLRAISLPPQKSH